MKRNITLYFVLILGLSFVSITPINFEVPKNWPKPIYDFSKNPLKYESIQLGRNLFYDPILSKNNTISCASCHSPYSAFTHVDHALSHGINNRIGTRNTPALMNLAWQKKFMWDGSIHHLDMQALAPISHPDEMGESMEQVVQKLNQSKPYPNLFYKAYGNSLITGERTLKSLSQFLLTLVSANSKYDSVMNKKTVFNSQQQNGYRLFKLHCASCHAEPLFSTYAFENNGLPIDTALKDVGRMKISGKPQDSLCFKVPSLRNIEYTFPYMHDGRFKKLSQVLNHYTNGIQPNKTLSEHLKKPIILNSNEKTDLVAFLFTLSDRSFLFNPKHADPHLLQGK